ncbi:MAG: iron-sulfur cluster carrier protein MrpORP [Planctomycetota bacterium]
MSDDNKCGGCSDTACRTNAPRSSEAEREAVERQALQSKMGQIKHKLVVLSGKGGVGKSTVATNLATAFAMAGKKVGLLDVDIHGPSVPKLLNVQDARPAATGDSLLPVNVPCDSGTLQVMSIGFLLPGQDDAVIWRGPMKFGVIKQFLKDVAWGELDYLVVDSPPGTGDEPLSVVQLIENAEGAVVVTTPQQVAVQDVRKCVTFCRQLHLPVLGIVENMSGFTCPKCGERAHIFGSDGGKGMAESMDVPYLGSVPLEIDVVRSGESGQPIVKSHPDSETASAFQHIVRQLMQNDQNEPHPVATSSAIEATVIAVPVANGKLGQHFGHCDEFALFHVGPDGKTITDRQKLTPPPHEPGVLPQWLHEQGATVIIAGGMGVKARNLFSENDIKVVVGAPSEDAESVVNAYLNDKLETGSNICDH